MILSTAALTGAARAGDTSVSPSVTGLDAKMAAVLGSLQPADADADANANANANAGTGAQLGTVHELNINGRMVPVRGALARAIAAANQRAVFEAGRANLNALLATGQANLRAEFATGQANLNAQMAQQQAQQRATFAVGQAELAQQAANSARFSNGGVRTIQLNGRSVPVGGALARAIAEANQRALLATGQANLNAEFATGQANLRAEFATGQAELLQARANQAAAAEAAFMAQQDSDQPNSQLGTTSGQLGAVSSLDINGSEIPVSGALAQSIEAANQRAVFAAGQANLNAELATGQANLNAELATGQASLAAQAAQAQAQAQATLAAGQAGLAAQAAQANVTTAQASASSGGQGGVGGGGGIAHGAPRHSD
jgi:hypothetical protein